jgi:ABC-type methionine transport system permease subunit
MEFVGLFAGACVLATFCMQSMLALRTFAIASNVLFIIYAGGTNLPPILLLHIILLPINGWTLGAIIGGRRAAFALCFAAAFFVVILVAFGLPYAGVLAGPPNSLAKG